MLFRTNSANKHRLKIHQVQERRFALFTDVEVSNTVRRINEGGTVILLGGINLNGRTEFFERNRLQTFYSKLFFHILMIQISSQCTTRYLYNVRGGTERKNMDDNCSRSRQ